MIDERELEKKENWGPGQWQEEPDRVEFTHVGLPCILNRNTWVTGAWCGYAAVPPGHPLYGKHAESVLDVHGGLTYSGECHGAICHAPKPGEPDKVWWFGFDCAHAGDLSPRVEALLNAISPGHRFEHDTYRTMDYARKETERLAEQLAAFKPSATKRK
jgi:hypothetical protein